MTYEEQLQELRTELNDCDRALLETLDRRRALSLKVAALKQAVGKPVLDPDREGELLCRLGRSTGRPEEVRELYQTVLRQSRGAQRAATEPERVDDGAFAYGLLGESLVHSLSPELHSLLGFCGADDYRLVNRRPEELDRFFAESRFAGLNVTIPYKEKVLPYCRRLSPEAAAIGAVNTLRREADGSLSGFNTDLEGFRFSLRRLGFSPAGKLCLVLGSGGAGKMACWCLTQAGARAVCISRKGPVTYEMLDRYRDAALLVNATPVGMYPYGDECPVKLERFPALEAVLDLVYRPYRTKLVLAAESRQIPALGGLPMLAAQAMLSERIWQGQEPGEPDEGMVEEAVDKLLKAHQNLVLVGMPGSGKSTQARILAGLLKRPVFDTDDAFRYFYGCTPGVFIRTYGEPAFRQEESTVVRELARKEGIVLSTGGGAVLAPENRAALKQNGRIILLTRPLENLSTFGRPLSQGSGALERMERERLPIYRAAAELEIPVEGRKYETAELIIRRALGEEYLPKDKF